MKPNNKNKKNRIRNKVDVGEVKSLPGEGKRNIVFNAISVLSINV